MGWDKVDQAKVSEELLFVGDFQTGWPYIPTQKEEFSHIHLLEFNNINPFTNGTPVVVGAIWEPAYTQQMQIREHYFNFAAAQSERQYSDNIERHQQASMSAEIKVNDSLSVQVGAQIKSAQNEFDSVLYDSDIYSMPLTAFYSIGSNFDLSLGYQKSFTKAQSRDVLFNDDKLQVGIRGEVTPDLHGEVKVGIQSRENTFGVVRNRVTGSSRVKYKLNDLAQIGSSVSKNYTVGPKGENLEKVETKLEFDFSVNELLLIGTNVAVFNYEDIDKGTESDLANAGLHFSYRDGDLFNLSAGYSVTTPEYDDTSNSRKVGHLLNFSASIQF